MPENSITRSARMSREFGAVLACLLLAIAVPALGAILPIPSMSGVTSRDRLAHSVASADAVVIAVLQGKGKVPTKRLSTDATPSIQATEWRFAVQDWIKGRAPGAPNQFTIGHNRFMKTPPDLVGAENGTTLLLFLTKPVPQRTDGKLKRFNPAAGWSYILNAEPSGYAAGASVLSSRDVPTIRSTVDSILSEQTPAHLVRNATTIVEGIPDLNKKQVRQPGGEPTACTPLSVSSVLKGSVPQDTIYIYSRIPFYHRSHSKTIAFLRYTSDGAYEVTAGPAGIITFDQQGYDRIGKTAQQWMDEIERHLTGGAKGGQ